MKSKPPVFGVSLSFKAALVIVTVGAVVWWAMAAPPPELPGEEITHEQYLNFVFPIDTIRAKIPIDRPESETWLDRASRTWDAPGLSRQIAEDEEKIRMGMGALFVPCMSNNPNLEPDIEVQDTSGQMVHRGKAGRKYSVVPGKYIVILGSGRMRQKIAKVIDVRESRIVPVLPAWSGLAIDVVDENNIAFRGEYELIRLEDYEPFGRGFGRDPDLGEELKTWILKPGTYKIFSVGESYQTTTNFVTVRLLPGEFVRFMVVERPNELKILGGGNINTEVTKGLSSNWKYRTDVGGSVLFNVQKDDQNDTTINVTSVALLLNSRLNYKREAIEWDSRLRIDEGLIFEKLDIARLESSVDELRLTSLVVWRIFPKIGPYARGEIETDLFPVYERAPRTAPIHYWITVNSDSVVTEVVVDSSKGSKKLIPSFSPIRYEAGIGANMTPVSRRAIEARFLVGFGFGQDIQRAGMNILDYDTIYATDGVVEDSVLSDALTMSHTVLQPTSATAIFPEFGPEAALDMTLRLGRYVLMTTEMKLFMPVERFKHEETKPDFSARNTASWRVSRSVTLDYQYTYTLRWPEDEVVRRDDHQHRILIRFTYTSR